MHFQLFLVLVTFLFAQNISVPAVNPATPVQPVESVLPPPPPITRITPPPTATDVPSSTALIPPSTQTKSSESSNPTSTITVPQSSTKPSETLTQSKEPTTASINSVIVPLAILVACILVAMIGIYVFRKWSLSPSSGFRKRIQEPETQNIFKGSHDSYPLRAKSISPHGERTTPVAQGNAPPYGNVGQPSLYDSYNSSPFYDFYPNYGTEKVVEEVAKRN